MNALVIDRAPEAAPLFPPRLRVVPGSAVVFNGKPLFLADVCGEWSVTPAVAYRLCRLGKGIEERFASRYYDACAPALLTRSAELAEVPGYESAVDGAMVLGAWAPLDGGPFTFSFGSAEAVLDPSPAACALDRVVEMLARAVTLHMGDALVAWTSPLAVPAEPGMTVTARRATDPAELLKTRIK